MMLPLSVKNIKTPISAEKDRNRGFIIGFASPDPAVAMPQY
ncbi:hypothetical protein [Aneurinibacillus terranovensis]|nr:hypothetical protein [Aneurinibacillus terranovensis]